MTIRLRAATPNDAHAMCDVINPIIAEGSTTAHRNRFDVVRMIDHYIAPSRLISCTVALIEGKLEGFQMLESCDPGWTGEDALPADWAVIGSFVSQASQGKGLGQALFSATLAAARKAGVPVIDAAIRADNVPGLRYYSGLGFQDYARVRDVRLSDGTVVDRIRKRFDLPVQA